MGVKFLVRETLKIEGMACDHCVIRVRRAIASVQGVTEADVNLKTYNVEHIFWRWKNKGRGCKL